MAEKYIIVEIIISINSLGISVMACINAPPTFINPNKAADKKTPIGVFNPSKATAIPSYPCVGNTPTLI